MSAVKLLHALRTIGIKLSLAGEDLKLRVPKGITLPPELHEQVKEHKSDLLHILKFGWGGKDDFNYWQALLWAASSQAELEVYYAQFEAAQRWDAEAVDAVTRAAVGRLSELVDVPGKCEAGDATGDDAA